jgi:hypothetical protein
MSAASVVQVCPGIQGHHARTDLVPDRPHPAQLRDPVRTPARQRRVDRVEERRIARLEAEQEAVGPGLAPRGQVVVGPLAEAERNGQVRFFFDRADDAGDERLREARILARLKDDGAVAELHRLAGAREDLVPRHPVALHARRPAADAAVKTAADTVVRDLDEPRR